MRIINQMVDTLKFHIYKSQDLTETQITDYNAFILRLRELKQEAMTIKGDALDRYVDTKIKATGFRVMATAKGRYGVELQNGDITLMFQQITSISNNPIMKVEFRSEFLTRYGYVKCINQVNKLISSFLPKFQIKVSEIHLATDIQGYDFTAMDKDRMSFRNRGLQDFTEIDNTLFGAGSKKTGFSFGKDALMLRIYDKTHQISKNLKAGYVVPLRWEFNKDYNENEKVFRIEVQMRRSHLKTLIGKDGILDGFENVLNSIPDLWSYAMKRFVHYDLTKEQCIDIYTGETKNKKGEIVPLTYDTIKKRKQRAGISKLWETISKFNNHETSYYIHRYSEVKKPETQYVVNAYKGMVSTFVKTMRGDFDSHILKNILVQADEESLNKKGYSILDSAKLKALDYIQFIEQSGVYIDGYESYQKNIDASLMETLLLAEDKKYRDAFIDECIKRNKVIVGASEPVNLMRPKERLNDETS